MGIRRWKWKKGNRWPLFLGFFLALLFLLLWLIEDNIHPVLLHIAQTEVKKIAQDAITEGIKEQLALEKDLREVMKVEKGADGRITLVQMDPLIQARIYTVTTEKIQEVLKHLRDKPIEISLGEVLQSNVFAKFGPDIPVEIWPKGASTVSIIPKMEAKGINTVMITLVMKIHTDMGVIVPFSEKDVAIDMEYPLAQTVVVGEVPEYYFFNDQGQMKMQTPVPQLPEEKKKK